MIVKTKKKTPFNIYYFMGLTLSSNAFQLITYRETMKAIINMAPLVLLAKTRRDATKCIWFFFGFCTTFYASINNYRHRLSPLSV